MVDNSTIASIVSLADLDATMASESPVGEVKKLLAKAHHVLREQFDSGVPVTDLVHQRAWLIDQVVVRACQHKQLPKKHSALVAVGGYGRGELHPGSDIDIMILLHDLPDPLTQRELERFITWLWDIGLEVGHSVRTVKQCVEQAANDITVITNLVEARFLAGDEALFNEMLTVTGPDRMWPADAFFAAKYEEQQRRHNKFDDVIQNLEPYIKDGVGGLRDIETIGWVAKRYFGASDLTGLVDSGFLTKAELQALNGAWTFLWRIRMALHFLTGRRQDRLLFEHQRVVAKAFGFIDNDDTQLDVERFMKMYYRNVREVSYLNEMLLELLRETIDKGDANQQIIALNRRFQIRDDYIEVTDEDIFRHYPFAMLEIFALLQQHRSIKGIRASTIRLIRDYLPLIDNTFRRDLRCRSLFMEIVRQPTLLTRELQRMHRYGVLSAYLPAFEGVTGTMQFDLYHVYTVDEHILFVVRHLEKFFTKREQQTDYLIPIIDQIPKVELLFLAGFFHDVGKGRGGDHSELGEEDAAEFCRHHGLGLYDTSLVSWLVKHHLLLSATAQRQDIADPDVINDFARRVGDIARLNYLLLLTLADIQGTNPNLWTSWRRALIFGLYKNTAYALRRGIDHPLDKQERIAEVQGEVLATFLQSDISKASVIALWESLGEEYFLRHWPNEVEWQTKFILRHPDSKEPLIGLRSETPHGGTEIFVYTKDEDYLFAATTRALAQCGLTVLDARVLISTTGYTLNTFVVLDASTNKPVVDRHHVKPVVDRHHVDTLIATIQGHLADKTMGLEPVNQRQPRRERSFTIPLNIVFSEDPSKQRTIMEITTKDHIGLLSQIGTAMQLCGVRLHNARVATYGERAEDIFYITDMDNKPITDPLTFESLEQFIGLAVDYDAEG